MTKLVEINTIETTKKAIKVTGKDMDQVLLEGNLDGDIADITFEFPKNRGAMTYLYKVAKKFDGATLQEKLDSMVKTGAIILINDSFRVKEA